MIPVVYEDKWLLIADKPSGMLVIPTPKNESRTLTNILNEDLKRKNIPYRLHPCHRLDRDTSGLVIYAKGKAVQKRMMDEFKDRKIKKTYIAFIQDGPAERQGEIRGKVDGRDALTRYRVLEERNGLSVVEVTPLTGRKNQIRLHFKKVGRPILGESRFAFRRDFKIKAKRLCLHAKALEFVHPMTKERVKVEAQIPEKMAEIMDRDG